MNDAERWQDREVGLVGLLVAMFGTVAIDSWAITVLWGWFLVPVGVTAIGMGTAAGIDLIANLIHRPNTSGVKATWSNLINRVVMVPLLALAVGAIVRKATS